MRDDSPHSTSSSAGVPHGFESLFPSMTFPQGSNTASFEPSAPSMDDEDNFSPAPLVQPVEAQQRQSQQYSSPLPHNSPAYIPSSPQPTSSAPTFVPPAAPSSNPASSAVLGSSPPLPANSPSLIQSQIPAPAAAGVKQPPRRQEPQAPPVQQAPTPEQHQVIYHPASVPADRVPALWNMWMGTLWFAPAEYA